MAEPTNGSRPTARREAAAAVAVMVLFAALIALWELDLVPKSVAAQQEVRIRIIETGDAVTTQVRTVRFPGAGARWQKPTGSHHRLQQTEQEVLLPNGRWARCYASCAATFRGAYNAPSN